GRAGVWDANSSGSSSSSSASSQASSSGAPVHDARFERARAAFARAQATTGGRGTYVNRVTRSAVPAGGAPANPGRTGGYAAQAQRYAAPAGGAPALPGGSATTGTVSKAGAGGARNQLLDYNETVDGRRYIVHLPHSYSPTTPSPVVIVFHGLGMDGTSARALSAMDLIGEQNGFITVYPDGMNRRWNDGLQRTSTDDVGFVADMLNAIARKFKVDSRRIYACGISNGGFFTQRLACEMPERFAAIGVVAATACDAVCARCNTHRGMPVVYFIGTDDPLFPREGETKELGKLGDALGLTDLGVKSMSSVASKFAGVMTPAEAPE